MNIRPITVNDWSCIVDIQAQIYGTDFLESLDVLKSKWQLSPDSCFVCENSNGDILAYLLSHPWNQSTPPKWNQLLPQTLIANTFVLHDLAVLVSGKGIGKKMVEHFLESLRVLFPAACCENR